AEDGIRDRNVTGVQTCALPILVSTPLYTEPFALLLPAEHPLVGRRDLSLDVLVDLPLLMLDEGHCLRDQTMELCRRVSAPVLGRWEERRVGEGDSCALRGRQQE